MNLSKNNGKLSNMSTASSSVSWKSGDQLQFPAGLRVLVVDDDPTCLLILEKMLRTCLYEVTRCNRAEIALSLLRENKNGFDIVISDVHMPDMDGFKLLEHIGLEMDLPVIMMSADDSKNVVMKGVTHGACDYLIKPVRIEALKNIWQHVVRRRKHEWKELEQTGSVEEGRDRNPKQSEEADYSSSGNEGSWRNTKRRKDDEEDTEDNSMLKKARVVWSVELHQQFVVAVNQLGIEKAVPKKILEMMNVPGLTRENVASHLQKYRLYLRRLSGVPHHQTNLSNPFIDSQDASFGALSSLNGLDYPTLAVAGQLPAAQSLATLQAAGFFRPNAKPSLPMSVVDQRNLFSFETPKMRFGDGPHVSTNKQINLLHGILTTMEPKQLASLHQSAQSMGCMNMQVNSHGVHSGWNDPLLMQMGQASVPRIPSSMGQPMLNFPMNQTAKLPPPGNSFTSSGLSNITPKLSYQEDINSQIKESAPSYDIFNDLQQHKTPDWDLGMSFDTSRHSISSQSSNLDALPVENSIRVKDEIFSSTSFFPEDFSQEDLMSALLKQSSR